MDRTQSLLSAKEDITEYLPRFKKCYEVAIEQYTTTLDSYNGLWTKRSKAIIFQNIIINEIKSEFSEDDVSIIEKHESLQLILNNYISARFKKLNEKGLPSNHRSSRNDAIISQQLTFGFKDFPQIAFIDVGYILDMTGAQFELLKIICRKNNDILWDLYFHDAESDAANTEQGELPIKPKDPQNTPAPSRIKINKEHKKAK